MPKTDDTNEGADGADIDPDTAHSEEADADFAAEHTRPTVASEPPTGRSDESVPTDYGGMDMKPGDRRGARGNGEDAG